ncbi:hypothetical protein SAMN02745824_2006 [Parasphingorhabdus marina DSM 22363]|uniref:Secreted protein n=2 Tax=Parasphingorhabdus marina TaxID=394732 RepID=A0A1N6EN70_9SPHN|nr:hypothetical protein SAMN02745824_2006 [Parasphingorhabdus marina DSM 22363]
MGNKLSRSILLFSAIITLSACERTPPEPPTPSPHDIFFERLSLLCSKTFSGQLVSSDAADEEMRDKKMLMHVAECGPSKIEIPFHVALDDGDWDRSRTWIITRNDETLTLKHRHLHQDGTPDDITNYGGTSINRGTDQEQAFPVDQESITLFREQGLDQSITNIWSLELSPPGTPKAIFAYQLKRTDPEQSRNFRVEFDLSSPLDEPPPAWGQ